LARGDDLARLLEDNQRGDFVALARLIVARQVFGFEGHGCLWMPLFQFELHDLSVREAPRWVLAELGAVFDSWSLAVWFTQPNVWPCEQRPTDTLGKNLPAVLDAARSALRQLTCRSCLNRAYAVGAESSAARPRTDAVSPDTEQSLRTVLCLANAQAPAGAWASAVGAQRRPPQPEPPPGAACRDAMRGCVLPPNKTTA
jgi:hypothetical protein